MLIGGWNGLLGGAREPKASSFLQLVFSLHTKAVHANSTEWSVCLIGPEFGLMVMGNVLCQ